MVKQRLGRLLAVTAAVAAISGTGAAAASAAPLLEVDGGSTAPGFLWIVNNGDDPAAITDVQITAGDLFWVGRDPDECTSMTLSPGGGDGCWIRVGGTYGSLEFSLSGYPSQTINLR
jgi:hypothetical protein